MPAGPYPGPVAGPGRAGTRPRLPRPPCPCSVPRVHLSLLCALILLLGPARWLAMVAQLSRSKPHILAVAPSNVAVDNMIQRIMDKGFHDGGGGRYNPSILRLGAGSKVTERASHFHCRSLLFVQPFFVAFASSVRHHPSLLFSSHRHCGNVVPFQVKTVTLEDTLDAEQAAFRALSGDDRGAHTRRLEGQLDALLTEVGRKAY